MCDSTGQGSVIREVRIDMDWVEVAGDFGIGRVRRRSEVCRRRQCARKRIWGLEEGRFALFFAVTLKVRSNRVPNRYTITVIDGSHRNQSLQLVTYKDSTSHINRRVGVLVFVDKRRLHSEYEVGTGEEGLGVIFPVEPFFGLEHANSCSVRKGNNVFGLINDLERVLIVRNLLLPLRTIGR
jgi:hypothetical protein